MRLILALCAALALVTNAAENTWKRYVNARFGFAVDYPPTLVASREPDNGGGREFHTADKDFSLTAVGHFLGAVDEAESLETRWQEELRDLGKSVTYKRKTRDWYVVSGVKEGVEYYHKVAVKGRNWAAIRITYPHAKNKLYDPWVERISRSFVPFLQGDYDRAE